MTPYDELPAALSDELTGAGPDAKEVHRLVLRVAETGVDCISVGAPTHSVRVLDLGLDLRQEA